MCDHLGLGHRQSSLLVPGTRLEKEQGQVRGAAGVGGAAGADRPLWPLQPRVLEAGRLTLQLTHVSQERVVELWCLVQPSGVTVSLLSCCIH